MLRSGVLACPSTSWVSDSWTLVWSPHAMSREEKNFELELVSAMISEFSSATYIMSRFMSL